MIRKTWLLLDCNYLCHRAKHSTGGLSFENTPTGVIYGLLKTVAHFQELFNTPHVAFCWDSKTSKRKKIFSAYKAHRASKYEDMDEDTNKLEEEFRWQMQMLRREYLPTIGYKNVFVQRGYEADDIIASICLNLSMLDEAIIVSSDQDLYQLIESNISLFNPTKGKMMTLQGFKEKYGIEPYLWNTVKIIAGCNTDGVPGIEGVGEKTVVKYLKKELKETTKTYQKITNMSDSIYRRNKRLITLPFKGTKVFKLQDDEITQEGWNTVIEKLGMISLRDKAPIFRE